jgi:hypothetical protein
MNGWVADGMSDGAMYVWIEMFMSYQRWNDVGRIGEYGYV